MRTTIETFLAAVLLLVMLGAYCQVQMRKRDLTTCGGEFGKHCGCAAKSCSEPCSSCCKGPKPCPKKPEPLPDNPTCR